MAWFNDRYPVSMTVGERRAKAMRTAEKLGRRQKLDPVVIDGQLAVTWWGKAWNRNLEAYADYSNRLPRGRSYARHGSVIDLRIEAGSISALVQGSQSRPYEVKISMVAMDAKARAQLIEACSGKLDSADALLAGRFPEDMARLLTAETTGLFPDPRGIRFSCSCPDSASLCKHVAAALYGVGARLDRDPALFFLLRKVEMEQLVTQAVQEETQRLLRTKAKGESALLRQEGGELSALFGIDLGSAEEKPIQPVPGPQVDLPRRVVTRPQRNPVPDRGTASTIRDSLRALDALSREISRLESSLKSVTKRSL